LKGTLKLAFKLLVNDTAKFTALLMGITFAVFLMMFVTSMFVGVLNHASATVINIGSTIWVMDPAVQTVANTVGITPNHSPDVLMATFERLTVCGGKKRRRALSHQQAA